mgnify:CR=1 FL=1
MRVNPEGEKVLLGLINSGKFVVDDQGRIWRAGKRSEHKTPAGYLQLRAMVNGTRYYVGAHRIVWAYFKGPIPDGMIVNHKNGIKDDNRLNNLELNTYSGNMSHAMQNGLKDQYGEKNPASKLSDRQIAQIRLAYAGGGYTMKTLGEKFGVSFKTISKIVRGQRRAKQGGPIQERNLHKCVCDRDPITGRYVGKKKAGRLLDGQEWQQKPERVVGHELQDSRH